MPLDAKQIVAKNKSLVGFYVAALLPIPLWFVLVGSGVKGGTTPKGYKGPQPPSEQWQPASFDVAKAALKKVQGDIDTLSGKINKKETIYTQDHLNTFRKRNDALGDQVKQLAQVIRKADEPLEVWFAEYPNQPADKEPNDHGSFVEYWKKHIGEIEAENSKIVGFDANTKKSNLYTEPPANTPGAMREWMKKFTIQKELVEAVKQVPDATIGTAIIFQSPPAPISGPPGQPAAKPPYKLFPVTFGVALSLRDVPRIVREILARPIVFRVTKVDVELRDFALDKSRDFPGPPAFRINETGQKKYFDTFYYGIVFPQGKGNLVPANDDDEAQFIPEPLVKVELGVEAFDFDMSVIDPPASATPPPAEAPKEEKKDDKKPEKEKK